VQTLHQQRITTDYENLLPDFGAWLQKNVTPRKYNNIVEYLQSPEATCRASQPHSQRSCYYMKSRWTCWHSWIANNPGKKAGSWPPTAGRAKLVNRFGFSAGNRILNNPNLVT
jgi:hypothetical protein